MSKVPNEPFDPFFFVADGQGSLWQSVRLHFSESPLESPVQTPGLEVWRVVHLPQGGLGAHKVPHGTALDAVPANANEATKLLHTLNSEAAELSLEAAQEKFKAFGFIFPEI